MRVDQATSGIFPGEFSAFSDIIRSILPRVFGVGTLPQSRNWIGASDSFALHRAYTCRYGFSSASLVHSLIKT